MWVTRDHQNVLPTRVLRALLLFSSEEGVILSFPGKSDFFSYQSLILFSAASGVTWLNNHSPVRVKMGF